MLHQAGIANVGGAGAGKAKSSGGAQVGAARSLLNAPIDEVPRRFLFVFSTFLDLFEYQNTFSFCLLFLSS